MIKQPYLGRKIKELREEKGLTQKELSFRCNVSERTLQRIESGNVDPRAYTVKAISDQLEHDFFAQPKSPGLEIPQPNKSRTISLKSILAASIAILVFSFSYVYFSGLSDTPYAKEDVEQIIHQKNKKFMQLLNSGELDSVVEFYHDEACVVSQGCGKEFIRHYYSEFLKELHFTDLTLIDLSVGDTIAMEKGKWSAKSSTGEIFGGEYISEWRLRGNEWLIANEISGLSSK